MRVLADLLLYRIKTARIGFEIVPGMAARRGRKIDDAVTKEIKLKLTSPNFTELDCFRLPDNHRIQQKLLAAQKSYSKYESKIFYLVPSRPNFLTYLYLLKGDIQDAVDLNQRILKEYPASLVAIDLSIRIYLQKKDYTRAKNALVDLESARDADDFGIRVLLAKAEQAECLEGFGPDFYHQAAHLYEEVLQCSTQSSHLKAKYPKEYLVYGYELALIYNRLMNGDNYLIFQDKADSDAFDPCKYFAWIKTLLLAVIHAYEDCCVVAVHDEDAMHKPSTDVRSTAKNDILWLEPLAARSWVNLGYAFSKYRNMGKPLERSQYLPHPLTESNCIENGLHLAPDDGVVLEMAGRYYNRYKACDENDFIHVCMLFLRCIQVSPGRHKAYHHLGMAYRKAWIHSCGFPQVRVDDNYRKQSSKQNFPESMKMCSKELAESLDRLHLTLPSTTESSTTLTKPRATREVNKQNHAPPQQFNVEEFPKPKKEPPYYLQLRAGNPRRIAGTGNDTYLQKAKEFLEKANELTEYTSVKYVSDLARINISCDQNKEALELFAKANMIPDYTNSDKRYLYEQWAFLEQDMAIAECNIEKNITNIKQLYLDAIRLAVSACKRSLAFHKLYDIVVNQLENDSENEALEKELAVLHHTVQLYDVAKPQLESFLARHPRDIDAGWCLVELLHKTGEVKEAFKYLDIIQSHSGRNSQATIDYEDRKDLAFRVCLDAALFDVLSPMDVLFDIYLPSLKEKNNWHIMLVGEDSNSPLIEAVVRALRVKDLLKVYLACHIGLDDIDPGDSFDNAVESNARRGTKSVIFFKEDMLDGKHTVAKSLMKGIMSQDTFRNIAFCCVTNHHSPPGTMPVMLENVPSVSVSIEDDVGDDEKDFAFIKRILKALFNINS